MSGLVEFQLKPNADREGTYILKVGNSRRVVTSKVAKIIEGETKHHNPTDGKITVRLHELFTGMGLAPDAHFDVIQVRPNS